MLEATCLKKLKKNLICLLKITSLSLSVFLSFPTGMRSLLFVDAPDAALGMGDEDANYLPPGPSGIEMGCIACTGWAPDRP